MWPQNRDRKLYNAETLASETAKLLSANDKNKLLLVNDVVVVYSLAVPLCSGNIQAFWP